MIERWRRVGSRQVGILEVLHHVAPPVFDPVKPPVFVEAHGATDCVVKFVVRLPDCCVGEAAVVVEMPVNTVGKQQVKFRAFSQLVEQDREIGIVPGAQLVVDRVMAGTSLKGVFGVPRVKPERPIRLVACGPPVVVGPVAVGDPNQREEVVGEVGHVHLLFQLLKVFRVGEIVASSVGD